MGASGPTRRQPLPLPKISFRNPLDLLKAGVKLSRAEADELEQMLTEAILAYSEGLDGLITRTNAERATAVIWSTITEEDARTIARPIVEAGQKYVQFAFIARQVGRSYVGVKIGLITLPRFYETLEHYARHGGFLLWSRPSAQ